MSGNPEFEAVKEIIIKEPWAQVIKANFPEVSDEVLAWSEKLIIACSSCWRPMGKLGKAIVRGSVAKNMISFSTVGPKLQSLWRQMHEQWHTFLDPFWQEVIIRGAEGQDVDIRFDFGESCDWEQIHQAITTCCDQPAEENTKRIYYKGDKLLQIKEGALGRMVSRGRRNLELLFFETSENQWPSLKLDLGELPQGNDGFYCQRSGFGASLHDMLVDVGMHVNSDGIVLTMDELAISTFSRPDRPISDLRGNMPVALRAQVNSCLWGMELDREGMKVADQMFDASSLHGREQETANYILTLAMISALQQANRS